MRSYHAGVRLLNAPSAAARRNPHIDEQAVDDRGADRQSTIAVGWATCDPPCYSTAGSKVAIITFERFPHTRSDTSHRAVIASLIVAPYLRLRSPGASSFPVLPFRSAEARAALAMPARRRAQCIQDAPGSARLVNS
ncbi:hypothetical protein BSZ22_12680 [Bradyrhizobium canariense]|uniref:Uncharacterized protein n=1 Tax=Bradyrhizobium canariense TaxID=255045 RepID=A0A1X3FWE3_9BRAD|nr:hypothetical protein BSZ22_12680 [Bradyrhizobium canariense]OSI79576.1 hypothetical protein BSZ23_14370 [Bradyrhizobium canariense]OSI91259.1 hypothetical protein BSZ24_18170 [Bradyrhizobium canariense]OSI91884.1 hypothetical protein BSZ25_14020 [Bradyrhizobium canariense]OSJ05693.1 hypothetical protein BSZ16_11800 [Bradyrhizobium canariense]